MDLGLKGKRAVVTGATRGIGRAIADRLADEGCHVGICARDAAEVAAAVEALRGKGVRATGAALDVRDGEALRAWIAQAGDALGGLDILVPNVSALATGADDASWRAGFDIDIMATVHAVDAALPFLQKSDAASIVAVASISGVEVTGGIRSYSAVKAAVIAYMSNVSTALARKGIRANTVSPGTIYFQGGVWHKRELQEPELFKAALARNPMGRMGRPEEVANAVAFLASPAASFISGTNLIVDGAMTQRVQF